MKKAALLLFLGISALGCSTKDDGPSGPEGQFIKHLSLRLESGFTWDYEFKDQGNYFNKYIGTTVQGEVEKYYKYNDLNRLISVESISNSNITRYDFGYTGEKITTITQTDIQNAGTFTKVTNLTYIGDTVVANSPDDPENLFTRRYTFDSEGKVVRVQEYVPSINDRYFYNDDTYTYGSAGELTLISRKGYSYSSTFETYTDHPYLDHEKRFDYFETISNPLYAGAQNIYMNAVLEPKILANEFLNDGNSSIHSIWLLRNYEHYTGGVVSFNVTLSDLDVQENGLPKSGSIAYFMTHNEFDITYE
ncbi:MAG: hypothetical protein AAFP76_16520 [Bacteroidota bacterium]